VSEENLQKPEEETTPQIAVEGYEIIFDKGTNEITLKDPTGKTATLKATVIEPEDEEEDEEPLTVEEFRDALKRIDALGLMWTADAVPQVKPKSEEYEGALLSDEFEEIQDRYPQLPEELSIVVAYAITRNRLLSGEVGGVGALKEKAEVVQELKIIDADYRSEFFFKHSIKVPYFTNIDWEVVYKLEEKNVYAMPNAAYALLTLLFHNPRLMASEGNRHRTLTVAADLHIVERLISVLTDIKTALERSRKLAHELHKQPDAEKEEDAQPIQPELEDDGTSAAN
jgi:hypothetical protein